MINPCINCIEREPYCHARCETGIEYAKTKTIEKERIKQARRSAMGVDSYEIESRMDRAKRWKK